MSATQPQRLALKQEHEQFKSRLVDDVFGKDTKGSVQMEKVMMLIWQFRDDPSVVQFMAQFVAKFSGSRDVFKGIEFYLPQLAHMLIHLEADWDDAILERFALIIAQQSLHFALQLNWILQGSIEDYEPELPSGEPNPDHNALFYSRCIKLLGNVERCVVYGRPRSLELQRLYEKGKITKKEYEILEQADRRYNAFEMTSQDNTLTPLQAFGGELLYKRRVRRSCLRRKHWKKRYFCIQERMLQCYNHKDGTLVRSMPLEGAVVEKFSRDDEHHHHKSKYPHMFGVSNRNFHFVMRASSAEERERWTNQLEEEARARALFLHGDEKKRQEEEGEKEDSKHLRVVQDLTPPQRARYSFFRDERDYVRDLCDVAERLRFKERDERKKLAPGMLEELGIPPCVYVPLCNSTDIWRRVEQAIPKDVKVFNTKERCPVIMYFVAKRGERLKNHRGGMKDVNLDVAEYMHLQFDGRDDKEPMELIDEGEDEKQGQNESSKDVDEPHEEGVETLMDGEALSKDKDGSKDELDSSTRSSISAVWHDSSSLRELGGAPPSPTRGDGVRGNRQVQSFLRDNLASLPRNLFTRLESRRSMRRKSALDKASLPLQHVPILENRSADEADAASMDGVSVEKGSVIGPGGVLISEHPEGDIDMLSIDRAKEIICHGESWADKSARMLKEYKSDETEAVSEIVSLMAKSNDDLRQEVFVMQMIHYFKSVFADAGLPLWMKTYSILSVSKDTGLIEVITDATSIDGLKKSPGFPEEGGLRAYFEATYGAPESKSFQEAQRNFMQSLAAYSLVSYFLGLKDRHNGNIMIDIRGHLIFIDFGFAMGMAPGHEFSFERAPFKLTPEYVEVMGGPKSECFAEFRRLFVAGFLEARKNSQIALGLVEIMMYKSNYPCFTGWRYGHGIALKRFEKRLMLHVPDDQVERRASKLIDQSMDNFGTWFYDAFQKWSNGYAI